MPSVAGNLRRWSTAAGSGRGTQAGDLDRDVATERPVAIQLALDTPPSIGLSSGAQFFCRNFGAPRPSRALRFPLTPWTSRCAKPLRKTGGLAAACFAWLGALERASVVIGRRWESFRGS